MRTTAFRPLLLAAVLGATAAAACSAQRDSGGGPAPSAPAPSAPAAGSMLVRAQDGGVLITDGGREVLVPAGEPVWSPDGPGPEPRASIDVRPVENGADIVVTLVNPHQQPARPGRIVLGGFQFGRSITARDFRHDGKPYTLEHRGRPLSPGGWYYPQGLYSPVAVFGDERHTVGVSLIYPILEYRHQVRIGVFAARPKKRSPAATGDGLVWEANFNLNPDGGDEDDKHEPRGDLRPGETREYTLAVRIVRAGEGWERSLAPYAEHFSSTYGGVRYQRDPRPVGAFTVAASGQVTEDNPYGFRQERMRPDKHGYAPWAELLIETVRSGWVRTMVWMAAGADEKFDEKNMPYKFGMQWGANAPANSRLRDAFTQLPRVRMAGGDLGLWWSRSAQVVTSWSPPAYAPLDPDNPEHRAAAFADLDAALAAGATTIGLDAFRKMPVWDAARWLPALQEHAPGVKFIVEPPLGDVMHTMAPCFLLATRPGEGDLRLEHRHYLADMLNPGHEIWGFIRLDRLESFLGRKPSAQDIEAEMRRVARLGYVPVVGSVGKLDPSITAAESWRTLPAASPEPGAGPGAEQEQQRGRGRGRNR